MSTAVTSPTNSQAFSDVLARIALAADKSPVENHSFLGSLPLEDPEDTTDISLLSYESALRRPAPAPDDSLSNYTFPNVSLPGQPSRPIPQAAGHALSGQLIPISQFDQDSSRKRCTISIRLSLEEIELLRLRACESGVSVSAYIRSCVLEADSLRAQVKQAIAGLRPQPQQLPAPGQSLPTAIPIPVPPPRNPATRPSWLRRALALLLGRPITLPDSAR